MFKDVEYVRIKDNIMPQPTENLCVECQFHEVKVADISGRCKKDHVERHMSHRDIVNGWPLVNPSEKACGQFELRT